MGRILSTGSASNMSFNPDAGEDPFDPNQNNSTAGVEGNGASRAEEIESMRASLREINQFIRNVEQEIIDSGETAGWSAMRAHAVTFKNQLEQDLQRKINGEDLIHFSSSHDYAERLEMILANNLPPTRRGYHATSIPFDFRRRTT